MKDKERLSMYVDITRITITLCWIALIAFWCLKLFGGNWFEIMVENENFIKFSDLVQNTWLKYLVSLFTIGLSNYFFIGAIIQRFKFNGKYLLTYILSVITMWVVANFVTVEFIKMTYGYFLLIAIGIIFQDGWKKLFGGLTVILEFVFTTISLLTRNISLIVMSDYLTTFILLIDFYIMCSLYFLYSNLIKLKKEN